MLVRSSGSLSVRVCLFSGECLEVGLASEHLAEEIGGLVGRSVGLEGMAMWDVRAERVTDYCCQSEHGIEIGAVDAFRELTRVSGGRWDDVDPEEFVKELRRD